MVRKFRIISQIFFFLAITATFFFVISYPAGYAGISPWYLRLNPLTGLLATIASRSLYLPLMLGGITLVITILFGRLFCGFFCPLGAIIDFFDRYVFRRMRAKTRPPRHLQRVKYVLLILVAILSLFGVLVPLFLGPLLLYTRIMTLVANPLAHVAAVDALKVGMPLLRALSLERLALAAERAPLYYGTFGAVMLLFTVLAGSMWDRRFWCQYVCPTGAFLGLIGSRPLFRRRLAEETCTSCGKCARNCPVRAIDPHRYGQTAAAECIVCGVCTDDPRSCNRFGFGPAARSPAIGPDLGRRHVAAGMLAGIFMLPAFRTSATARHDRSGRFIRPPGALPEPLFAGRCLACGACMKACPSTAIQPAGFSDGVHRLYTPKIVPRIGGCEEKCHLCGHVCPTGAIRPLAYERKRFAKIGTAAVDTSRCLAWSTGKDCLVCDEVCPYNAIEAEVIEFDGKRLGAPRVKAHLCLGCGMCEQHCPVFDDAAIRVFKSGENRRASGPYVSARQRGEILEERRRSEVIDYHRTGPDGRADAPPSTTVTDEPLPEGFIIE